MLITSKQEAVFYEAYKSELKEIDAFEVLPAENTDKEGQFKTRSRGIVVRSGSMFERNDNALIRDFMREIDKLVKKHLNDGEFPLYVFTPQGVKSRVSQSIERHGKVSPKIIEGNYMHNHPLDLLGKILELKEGIPHPPSTNEEKKILSTGTVNFISVRNSSSRH